MNDRGTSEVDEFDASDAVEPTTVPFPATSNWINEGGEDQGEDHEFAELDPLSHKTGNDRGCRSGESCLEQEINGGYQAGIADGLSGNGRVEEEAPEIQPAVDDGVAVHEGVAHEPVGGHREGEHEQVLGEDIDGILLPAHACFDHGEAGVHEDHQDGGDQKPEVVGQESGGELRKLFGFGRQGEDAKAHQRQRRAGEPGHGAIGAEAPDALQKQHRAFQEAGLLQGFAPPLRWRVECSCHERGCRAA